MADLKTLKKDRAVLRTSFSKTHTSLVEELGKDDMNTDRVSGLMEMLRQRYQAIQERDSQIFNILSRDDSEETNELEQEQDTVDQYAMKYYEINSSVEKALTKYMKHESCSDGGSRGDEYNSALSQHSHHQNKRNFKLPVLQLKQFDGNLQEWLPFWSQFEKINVDPTLDASEKLGYLVMSMKPGSPAYQLVSSYPATSAMYPKVIEALKARYGRSDLLTEYYIRELLSIIINNKTNKKLSISQLYDTLQCHLRNLESLGVTADNYASILLPLVSSCLPQELLQVWERGSVASVSSCENPNSKDYLHNLMNFLRQEVEAAQKLELAKASFGLATPTPDVKTHSLKHSRKSWENIPTAAGLVNANNDSESKSCIFCSGYHYSQDCRKASDMTLEQRQECVMKHNACYSCLKSGHRSFRCKNRPKCTVCSKGHFAIICNNSRKSTTMVSHNKVPNRPCNVLMQSLVVQITNKSGLRAKKVRVLIDTGSQRSYILSSTAKEMECKPMTKELIQHALFGGTTTNFLDHNVYSVCLTNIDNSFQFKFDALDQPKICGKITPIPAGPWIEELAAENISLCDYGSSSDIEILLGSDVVGGLYTGNIVKLNSGLVAMETKLGWTISGKVPESNIVSDKSYQSVATIVTNLLIKEANISDLWSLDVLGIMDPVEKVSQAEIQKSTLDHFLATVDVTTDNRFEIRLPFLKNHLPLSNNYNSALKRLNTTIKKLNEDGYYGSYEAVLEDWQSKGIIEEVPDSDKDNAAHYLPHRHIVKIGSTTPIRPVFDASAKEYNKASLNQCLETGPNLIEKIPACLARFRENKIAVSGDIAKAFLQISVNEKDRNYLRFLWESLEGQLKVFRHCRVVFGVSPSPFILEACIKLHIDKTLDLCQEGKSTYPTELINILKDSFYVDNCLTSLNSIEQADKFISVATSVMNERAFELRGWEKTGDRDEKHTNVLGLIWDKSNDTLSINIDRLTQMDFSVVTKKVLLSAANRLFDPIGFVSSIAIIPKLLVQETWQQKLAWTEEVDKDTQTKFLQWLQEIPLLKEVCIPRWISKSGSTEENYQVHVFADASKKAYATAIFLRIEHNHHVTLRLLASKSRVAPVSKSNKRMTIPRLELLANSIAARLYQTVIDDYKLFNVKTFCWTDATTVLAWLERDEPWDVYVINRVKEIRSLTQECEWRHVPGHMNPADLPSRGSTVKKLVQLRWWEGPSWLKDVPEKWPQSEVEYDEDEVNKERRKTVVSSMINTSENKDWYYKYFSNYQKLVRMIAWLGRFKDNATYKRIHGRLPAHSNLSAEEFQKAENKVLLLVQKEAFTDIEESRLSNLLPFIDEDKLIRLKTKISNRQDDRDFRFPIVLPNSHPVVQRLIQYHHRDNCHAGTQILLSILRERYWILGGRKTIRKVINKCTVCKRYTAKKLEAVPIPLPEDRVRNARVFETTGVDLAGPLYIKIDNNTTKKVWICIYTCAVYRAVRFELLSKISTDSFLQALKRFCSRNGRPKVIYSDNGSNFVGFDNSCSHLDWKLISEYSSAKRITWHFNPPSAPWWGGWWERLIGILKKLLRRVLGRASVDYETLQTLLCDVERVMNSRPLTYLSDDPQDLTALTPSMFLNDLEGDDVPEYNLIQATNLRKSIKYRGELRLHLNQRFRSEYLGRLQLFSSKKKTKDVRLGEIVLIGDDNSKRTDWPLGRVTELIQSKDGNVRVVHILTKGGMLIRPIQRVYPLELELSHDELSPCESVLRSNVIDPVPVTQQSSNPIEVTDPCIVVKSNDIDSLPVTPQNKFSRCGRLVRKPKRYD